jgi:hypothetical protein
MRLNACECRPTASEQMSAAERESSRSWRSSSSGALGYDWHTCCTAVAKPRSNGGHGGITRE